MFSPKYIWNLGGTQSSVIRMKNRRNFRPPYESSQGVFSQVSLEPRWYSIVRHPNEESQSFRRFQFMDLLRAQTTSHGRAEDAKYASGGQKFPLIPGCASGQTREPQVHVNATKVSAAPKLRSPLSAAGLASMEGFHFANVLRAIGVFVGAVGFPDMRGWIFFPRVWRGWIS